jgi:hypothetical protein
LFIAVLAGGYAMNPFDNGPPPQHPESVSDTVDRVLPRLVRVGRFLRTDTNERFTGIGATDFDLLEKYLECGDCVLPVLRQRAHPWADDRPGFNTVRVWTFFDVCADGNCPPLNQRIGRLYPHEHPDFYDKAIGLANLAARHELRVQYTAFTGNFGKYTHEQQVAHWEGLIGVAAKVPSVWLDLVNEWDHQAMQGFGVGVFRQPPAPILASRGSGQIHSPPVTPVWPSLATYHSMTDRDGAATAAYRAMVEVADRYEVPVWIDETTRFPDGNSNPQQAYDVARSCTLLVAGCTFHSISGKSSDLWDAAELALALRWVEGARSLSLECQDGRFARLFDRESDQVIRAYQRGSGPGCIVDMHR